MKSKNKYFNPNPLKKETCDCVIRAFCAAEDASWDDIYQELCDIGFELKTMPNGRETTDTFLNRHGFTRYAISNKKGRKRPTVNEMANRSKTEGAFVCEVANHTVTVKDGAILDLWDSGTKSLYAYWHKD